MAHTITNDDDLEPEWLLQCQFCYHNIGGLCSSKSSNWYRRHPKGDVIRECYRAPSDMYQEPDTQQMKLC